MSIYEEWLEKAEEDVLRRINDKRNILQAAEIVYCSTEFLVGAPIKDQNGSYWYATANYIYNKLKESAALPLSVNISAEVEIAERILRIQENK